ncbi:MAG: hypothetical protein KQJ78_14660 [Deltaproteobacteria bacterium]|nr:hypothetical protein [Deltaproteobacteria bacterium]
MADNKPIHISQRQVLLSIIELSPLSGSKLARQLFPLVTGQALTTFLAGKGIHPTNICQGLAGRGRPGTQRDQVRPLVAGKIGLLVTDIWPDGRAEAGACEDRLVEWPGEGGRAA